MPIYVPGKLVLRQTSSTWAEGGDTVYDIEISGTVYRVHMFTTVGTSELVVMEGGSFEYLVVAGGGGGGQSSNAGGGGAGGLLKFVSGESGNTSSNPLLLNAQQYIVSVGSGGAVHENGSNSTLDSIIAIGGSRGASYSRDSQTGGSGGGGYRTARAPGSGISPQGYSGGLGSNFQSGGGGGAGGPGGDAPATNAAAGDGGIGKSSTITGTSIYYAGGGGGGGYNSGVAASGGSGGGGAGGVSNTIAGGNGTVNSGGGGGGSGQLNAPPYPTGVGGSGGSGIVIVRYAI
jgi:hypothetical protein